MASVPLQLEVNNQLLSIDPEWIPRWKFLIDYTTEEFIQDNVMQWTYSSEDELREWVRLNEDMDSLITLEEGVKYENKRPLSSVWRTVDFMSPTSLEYLRILYIDDKVNIGDRKRLYTEIGLYTRITKHKEKMNNSLFTSDSAYPIRIIHGNFNLYFDPIYEHYPNQEHEFTTEDKDKLLKIEWINVLTGIMVYTLMNVPQYFSIELGWESMPWNEVLDMVPCPDFFTVHGTDSSLLLLSNNYDKNDVKYVDKTYYALAGRDMEELVKYDDTTKTVNQPNASTSYSRVAVSGIRIKIDHYPLFLLREQNKYPEQHAILHTILQTKLTITSTLNKRSEFYGLTSSYNLSLRPNSTLSQLHQQIVDAGFSPVLKGGKITDFAPIPRLFTDTTHFFYPLYVSSLITLNALYRGKLLEDTTDIRRKDLLKASDFEEIVRYCSKTIGTIVLERASELLLEYYNKMEEKDNRIIKFIEVVIQVTEEVGSLPYQIMP